MKSDFQMRRYSYLAEIGFPILLSAIYHHSQTNIYWGEAYIIEANYNNKSILKTKEILDCTQLMKLTQDLTESFDWVNEIVLNKYEINLYERKDERINKSLPLQVVNSKIDMIALALMQNADDVIQNILAFTRSEEIRTFLGRIIPVKLYRK